MTDEIDEREADEYASTFARQVNELGLVGTVSTHLIRSALENLGYELRLRDPDPMAKPITVVVDVSVPRKTTAGQLYDVLGSVPAAMVLLEIRDHGNEHQVLRFGSSFDVIGPIGYDNEPF